MNEVKNTTGLAVVKKERENSKQLVNRFMRHLRRSGILRQAKGSIYAKRSLSPASKKKSALRKEERRKEYRRLEKLGKI